MDHFKILKRAFDTTRNYRVLWIFGILVALTAGASGGGGGGGGNAGNMGNGGNFGNFPRGNGFDIPPEAITVLLVIGIILAIFFVLLGIFSVVARYLGRNALILMVNEYEETGQELTIKEGFRKGWSRSAFQLFLMKLVITIPIVIIAIILFGLAAIPLLGWALDSNVVGVIGTIITIGAFFIVLFFVIAVSTIVSVLEHFFSRELVLQKRGLFDAMREGYAIVRRHLGDVAMMWLIMVGVGIGWAIVSFLGMLVFLLLGALLGGLPALAVGSIVSLFAEGPWPWIIGGIVALPIFILVVVVPNLFLSGLYETFKSTTWTLTYRELLAMEALDTGYDLPQEVTEVPDETSETSEPAPEDE